MIDLIAALAASLNAALAATLGDTMMKKIRGVTAAPKTIVKFNAEDLTSCRPFPESAIMSRTSSAQAKIDQLAKGYVPGETGYIDISAMTGRQLVDAGIVTVENCPVPGSVLRCRSIANYLANVMTGALPFNARDFVVAIYVAQQYLQEVEAAKGSAKAFDKRTWPKNAGSKSTAANVYLAAHGVIVYAAWIVQSAAAGRFVTLLDCPVNSPLRYNGRNAVDHGSLFSAGFVDAEPLALPAFKYHFQVGQASIGEHWKNAMADLRSIKVNGKQVTGAVLHRVDELVRKSIDHFTDYHSDKYALHNAERADESLKKVSNRVKKISGNRIADLQRWQASGHIAKLSLGEIDSLLSTAGSLAEKSPVATRNSAGQVERAVAAVYKLLDRPSTAAAADAEERVRLMLSGFMLDSLKITDDHLPVLWLTIALLQLISSVSAQSKA